MYIFVLLVCLFTLSGCGSGGGETSTGQKPSVFVSILPLSFFAERIAGDLVDVHVFVGPGQSPETFEPTVKQMTRLAEAKAYFSVGVPLEETLLPRIKKSFPGVEIVNSRAGIPLREFDRGHGHPGHSSHDPHVWLNPKHAKTIANNIFKSLAGLFPEQTETFARNNEKLLSDLDALDAELSRLLAPLAGAKMVVFHPAYGYFAEAYGMTQVAVEEGGVEPGTKHLAGLLENAQTNPVRAIFVQPQFSRTTAETMAKTMGAEVVTLDPLSADYLANLRDMAGKIYSAYAK
jgi:zinc transport system substrate-binding protein